MKLYTCSHCYNTLYFEDSNCSNCNYPVGFDAEQMQMITLSAKGNDQYTDINNENKKYHFCKNAKENVCNWLISLKTKDDFCKACDLNRTIPNLLSEHNHHLWQKIEVAKHRLVYSLFRLYLPVISKDDDETNGLAFDFLEQLSPDKKIITGHDEGVITLNIEEADDAKRAKNKLDLGERYRTLLGHFRHEIGHYYWDLLIKDHSTITKYRELFGDETKEYAQSLAAYYKNGASADWSKTFISPYATAHPWEDWAETWSHYMHLMDTLETAFYFGIGIHPVKKDEQIMGVDINIDPYTVDDFDVIFKMWLSFTFAANSLNRSIGYNDFYPFVLTKGVEDKLQFIHEVCQTARYSLRKLSS